MATARGHQGLLSVPDQDPGENSQEDHILHHLVNDATKPFAVSWQVNAPAVQHTGFASSAPVAHEFRQDGLSEWTGSFSAYYPKAAPQSGHLGLVTFSSGTVNKVQSFTLNFQQEEHDDTGMASSPPEWRDYQPGLWSISGTYRGRVDTAGAVKVGARGSAEFRLTTDDVANTISGTICITSVGKEIRIGSQVFIDYGFQFEGNATSAGTNGLFPAGALDEPELTYVSMRSAPSRTESGYCFISGLSVSVAVGSPIEVTGSLRGSGALTPA